MPLSRRLAVVLVALVVAGCGADRATIAPTSGETSSPSGGGVGASAGAGVSVPPSGAGAGGSSPPSAAVPGSPSAGGGATTIGLETVVDDLDAPLDVSWRPASPDDLYVVEQPGRIRLVRDGAVAADPFLDIAGIVRAGGEQGLLGLAFPPDPADRRFFVYYTGLDGSENLASYETTAGSPDHADPATGHVLLRMDDPYPNHNGGSLGFGPDGYLYVGTGDGGAGGDPLGSGRSLDTFLAKILRLDVSPAATSDGPYDIPSDNPFVARDGAKPEIFATGLRNPWRFRFDRDTGDLWIGDVGQNAWEEIDVARAGKAGLDFGWNRMEGFHCYQPADGCEQSGLTLPVTEYGHDRGCSVTGGTVYRADGVPALQGRYLFSDYCSGTFWTIPTTGDDRRDPQVALESGRSISAIAEGSDGELYATDLGGSLLRVVSAPGS